jgi:rhodanese-related sulfurtransferase
MTTKFLPLALFTVLLLGCGTPQDEAAPSAAPLAQAEGGVSDAAPPACDCAAPLDVVSIVDARIDVALADVKVPKDAVSSEEEAAAPAKDVGTLDVAPPSLCELSAAELHAALANKDFLLIDVHTPFAGTIPGTDVRIPYTDIAGLVAYIGSDLGSKVVLTCHSGGMSTSAGNALVSRGYRAVCELSGGMMAWTDAGYTLDMDGG